jgi:hypothetical protein
MLFLLCDLALYDSFPFLPSVKLEDLACEIGKSFFDHPVPDETQHRSGEVRVNEFKRRVPRRRSTRW